MTEEPTTEELAKMYQSSQNCADLVNRIVLTETLTDYLTDRLKRNVKHLENTVQSTYWTDEELAPFNAAITAGRALLPIE